MKRNYCKTLMTFFTTGLACATVLLGCPTPTGHAARNPDGTEPWFEAWIKKRMILITGRESRRWMTKVS